jgi:hypothetical protein
MEYTNEQRRNGLVSILIQVSGIDNAKNDGDVDVLVLNMNETPSLLRNDGGNKNNWIKLKLIGTVCNRTAIGARVRVVTGKHSQIDEVHTGTSVMSQSDLRLHFGVGQAKQIDLIEVKWPTTQKIEQFKNVEVNQILTIKEGEGIVKADKPASVAAPAPAPPAASKSQSSAARLNEGKVPPR